MDARRHALDLLATPQGDTRFGPSYLVRDIVDRAGCLRHAAYEALWGLVGEGLIYLDPDGQPGTDNWRWRLSRNGVCATEGGTWEPRDPDGFLRRLHRQTPDIDPGALVYLDEALQAFNVRCYLSSSVMLGVAAEQVFTGLADPLTLDAVADLLRVTRNDAGHPTSVQIDEDTARTHLAVAGGYLGKMTELRKHFEALATQGSTATSTPTTGTPG